MILPASESSREYGIAPTHNFLPFFQHTERNVVKNYQFLSRTVYILLQSHGLFVNTISVLLTLYEFFSWMSCFKRKSLNLRTTLGLSHFNFRISGLCILNFPSPKRMSLEMSIYNTQKPPILWPNLSQPPLCMFNSGRDTKILSMGVLSVLKVGGGVLSCRCNLLMRSRKLHVHNNFCNRPSSKRFSLKSIRIIINSPFF